MNTVLSYIVQKRLSSQNEDVATDALAFIFESSEAARSGFMKLLRGVDPDLPPLRFRTQQSEDNIRPDMCGFDESVPRVFVENKFWAGLTENQPVSYLQQLARSTQPSILLVVVPAAREQTIWRELRGRLDTANIAFDERDTPAGVVASVKTAVGPMLALTSWSRLLAALRLEAAEDSDALADLSQLSSLCDAADSDAFFPFSKEDITDQRIPTFIRQVNKVVQEAVEAAVTNGTVDLAGLRPQASWTRIGRYIRFSEPASVIAWIGVNFGVWSRYGSSPLWLVLYPEVGDQVADLRHRLESWATRAGMVCDTKDGKIRLSIGLVTSEEKDIVVKALADTLKEISDVLNDQ